MKRVAAALLFAVAVSGCSTSPKPGKPAAFHVEEIRREFQRLDGSYRYAGLMRSIGMAGGLYLRADGTFEYFHPSCTDRRITVGTWHPDENRIEFSVELATPLPKSKTVALGDSSLRVSYSPINQYSLRDAPWLRSGLEVVTAGNSLALYPLDPALRREIANKPSVWPMRKQDGTKR